MTHNALLQNLVTEEFRAVCHVFGKTWPDPSVERFASDTNEIYCTPNLAGDVMDQRNKEVFAKVVEVVQAKLNVSKFLLRYDSNSQGFIRILLCVQQSLQTCMLIGTRQRYLQWPRHRSVDSSPSGENRQIL